MSNTETITIKFNKNSHGSHNFKVIEVKVADPANSIYAVCSPIKMK